MTVLSLAKDERKDKEGEGRGEGGGGKRWLQEGKKGGWVVEQQGGGGEGETSDDLELSLPLSALFRLVVSPPGSLDAKSSSYASLQSLVTGVFLSRVKEKEAVGMHQLSLSLFSLFLLSLSSLSLSLIPLW